MSTVGIFILLLVAFVVLHRWYARPSARARRLQAAGGSGPRGAVGAVHAAQGGLHSRGEGAPGGSLAGIDGSGSAPGSSQGGSHGGGGASGSVGTPGIGHGEGSGGGESGNGGNGSGGAGSGDGD